MATPRNVVNAVYHRFAEGDTAGFSALCAKDIGWVVNGPVSLEKCQAFQGRSGTV
jgi:ketosteroid isomerase-like protein